LNPDAPGAGLPVFENQRQKYGLSKQQVLANFAKITTQARSWALPSTWKNAAITTAPSTLIGFCIGQWSLAFIA